MPVGVRNTQEFRKPLGTSYSRISGEVDYTMLNRKMSIVDKRGSNLIKSNVTDTETVKIETRLETPQARKTV